MGNSAKGLKGLTLTNGSVAELLLDLSQDPTNIVTHVMIKDLNSRLEILERLFGHFDELQLS